MTQTVITQNQINKALEGMNAKDAFIKFSIDQPHLALRFLQRYGYLPRTAVMTYFTLANMIGENGKLPQVSVETVDSVVSQINIDKEAVMAQFKLDQPEFSAMLEVSYGYVPSTAPMITLSITSQAQLAGDDFKEFMEKWMTQEAPEDSPEA